MNLHPDLSFVAMVIHASFVVQAVLALLLLLSLWSWWQIFLKMFALKRAASSTDAFEDEFWKGGDLTALYDANAPWIVPQLDASFTICIINNGGGRIFSRVASTVEVTRASSPP